MTLRTRQVIVVVGLAFLVIWALATWMGSAAQVPAPSLGPSPTGSIGSGPATFVPSGDSSPLP
jgi:hypothetical protein